MMTVTGGCRCGAVRYVVHGEPVYRAICHCRDCRRSAGAPMVAWALFAQADLTVTGTPVSYSSSPGVTRQFCGQCGTGLFYLNPTMFPQQVDVQAATFDDPNLLPPQLRVQAAEAPDWLESFHELPAFARYPEQ